MRSLRQSHDANRVNKIQFKDPRQEWELVNAWFVKQKNFTTVFSMRDIVKPENIADEKRALEASA